MIAEWRAYERVEPFGEARADLRMGVLATMIGNVYRREGTPPFKPSDFLLFRDPAAVAAEAEAHLKSILRRKRP